MLFGKKKEAVKTAVTPDDIAGAAARAVAEGDMVNLVFAFSPNSPLRQNSPELLHTAKYAYLRAQDGARTAAFDEALRLATRADIAEHNRLQLETKRPAQLHADLVLRLADNAVGLGKYTVAAQAYERLRVRERMRDLFAEQGDAALDAGDIERAAHGYRIASGLSYDYAAFPEPLPLVPNHATRALMLHAIYPKRPEESIALAPPERHMEMALEYLLLDPALASRLYNRPVGVMADFLAAYVRQGDDRWDVFAARYREASDMVNRMAEHMQQQARQGSTDNGQLQAEVALQEMDFKPEEVSSRLLGRSIESGEWWQYLKDLAFQHPAAILFVSRQMVAKDQEIILPRFYHEAPLGKKLGLYA